jgi:ABC-type amino acid transport substrate-binding protein/ABC-type amino acid transport system permease subunit
MIRLAVAFLAALLLAPPADAQPAAALSARDGARAILAAARSEAAAGGCAAPTDVLVRIICTGRLTVGLRSFYPGFSVRDERGRFVGFEPDIAAEIAGFLGVALLPRVVDPKTRIAMLAQGEVDLTIATMGHSVQRAAEVRFVLPHYYRSQTAVVGPAALRVGGWDDLDGQSVCLPLGSNSNIDFVRHHVRILTFDRPEQLVDALRFGDCRLVAHDDTFFAFYLADPAWAAQFDIRFRFAPLPWGMAVARGNAARLGALLDDLSVAFHADGTFLRAARANRLDTQYLAAEQLRWSTPACSTPDGTPLPACEAAPVDNADPADISAVAALAERVEGFAAAWLGVGIDLSMFKFASTIGLLADGALYSMALVIGTQVSTLLFALGFGWLMVAGPAMLRRPVAALTAFGQVTPLPLLMVFVSVVASGIAHYSAGVALVAAVFAIGIYNGSNAGRAISDAAGTHPGSFRSSVGVAGVQLVAFLINAAKGCPAAGMIGVPEFLNVVNDLSANARDRLTASLILLLFYVSLTLLVISVLGALRRRLLAA